MEDFRLNVLYSYFRYFSLIFFVNTFTPFWRSEFDLSDCKFFLLYTQNGRNYFNTAKYTCTVCTINIRRMPKYNTVLQSESDLFEPEIEPDSAGNCEFLALIVL